QVLFTAERAFDFDGLKTFAGLLLEIERERFDPPAMRLLADGISAGGMRASACIGRLAMIVMLSEQRKNLMVGWLQVPLLYTLHVAMAAERWRRVNGMSVRGWAAAAGRFEALASLAQYGFEHPDDPFPAFVPGPACLRAREMGHPLIPPTSCVRNDVDLADRARV